MKFLHCYVVAFTALFLITCQAQPTPTATEPPVDPRADEAQEIISNVEKAVPDIVRGTDNSYYRAVEYAARDALMHFPDDPRAESWKWKLAYYAILAGDTQLGNDTYIDLINTALNSGQVNIESLPSWFHPGELTEADGMIPFVLKVDNIMTGGDEKKYLITVSSFPGGSCFLVVQSFREYSTFLIYDGFPEGGFSIFSYDSLGCTLKDLTSDGNDEVVLENYKGGHVGSSYLRVMDISVVPMKKLPFASQNGENVFVQYALIKDFPISSGKILMRTVDYAQNCRVSLEKIFKWNGNEFVPVDMVFQADTQYAPLKECLFWAISYARWVDLDNGVKIIDQAIRQYGPVAVDEHDREKLDEVRIDKALLYLFANHPKGMRAAFEDMIQNPSQENGIWIEPIKSFLNTYKTPSDIYRACSKLVACVSHDSQSCSYQAPCARRAFEHLVENQFKSVPLSSLVENLRSAGVDIISTGWLDLDYDGKDELWLVIAPPDKMENSTNELWIASGYPHGISIFSDTPGLQGEVPDFQVEMITSGEQFVKYSEYWAFLWSRDDVTNEPVFRATIFPKQEYYNETMDAARIVELRHKLQGGAEPYELYVEYMNLKKRYDANPSLECVICYFDFGHIAELVGDQKTAATMYSKLIEHFPNHPLAILARSKLGK
ncbi:MAG: hypothetical protein EHM40_08555 [Chloroflexi bacterium]|nr:MAG: hypothetical protein EHM40_08555 [Chloroflexota bacterium]